MIIANDIARTSILNSFDPSDLQRKQMDQWFQRINTKVNSVKTRQTNFDDATYISHLSDIFSFSVAFKS